MTSRAFSPSPPSLLSVNGEGQPRVRGAALPNADDAPTPPSSPAPDGAASD